MKGKSKVPGLPLGALREKSVLEYLDHALAGWEARALVEEVLQEAQSHTPRGLVPSPRRALTCASRIQALLLMLLVV